MSERNAFGGENKNFLYTPMSEDEREVISRLVESDNLRLIIHKWGVIEGFDRVRFGDKVLDLIFTVNFKSPEVAIPVTYLDMTLETRGGDKLHNTQLSLEEANGGQPVWVKAGLQLQLGLSIAITQIDPALVKKIKPGALGLTTREGNRNLDSSQRKLLESIRASEKKVRELNKAEAAKSIKNSVY